EESGSIGMVTLNLPRLAYLSKNQDDFYRRLDQKMDVMARALKTKRQVLSKFLDAGLYPYTQHYLDSFDSCFSTIGVIGMNEACLNANWIGESINKEKALSFSVEVLTHMKKRLLDYQKKYQCYFNIEATPGESVSYTLVQLDQKHYPEMNEEDKIYYTNSTTLPAQFTEDVFEALTIQESLQSLYTGGSVFHVFLPEGIVQWKDCMNLVKLIADNYRIFNFTISPSYSVCPEHGYINGVEKTCPVCQKETEIWARVTGYYQPIEEWNRAKMQEFEERKNYIVK
ncbi:MAG: ribonucleoside triphosphate reductase, partial [Erysipelotrichaceae bacterium]|nr:ribonucleoside triphosphate reductase [Erysipelotrichaceae bacterium]